MIDLPFWDIFKEKDVDRVSREHREATVVALEAGDIPPYARRRIESQVASGSSLFSSTFTAKEYLLAREGRYLPISQVMGSAFIKMAWNPSAAEEIPSYVNTGELAALTLAHQQACDLALERLQKEAALLGADGGSSSELRLPRRRMSLNSPQLVLLFAYLVVLSLSISNQWHCHSPAL